jgi:DNA-binding CsgD family transcriptional regulator
MDESFPFAIGPEPAHEPDNAGAAVDLPAAVPLTYGAYLLGHRAEFIRFAEEMLGDPKVARTVVHHVLTAVEIDWDEILQGPGVDDVVRDMLLSAVLTEVHRSNRQEQLAERVARVLDLLEQMRASLLDADAEDSELGLYPVLRTLSSRQFDVVILKASDKSTLWIAWFLRAHPSTVDRNHKRALARIEEVMRQRRLLHPDTPRRPHRRGDRR